MRIPALVVALLPLAIPAVALSAPAAPRADLVDTAVAAGSFKTLTKALGAAGLVETLKGPGPFTVFAPTDEAFARLPAGTVEGLLRPERLADLKAVLTYHVVSGRVLAKDLLPVAQATTVQGAPVAFGLRVGSANVVTPDVLCTNGVIHVIDAVLLPPAAPPKTALSAPRTIRDAIERGAPAYNAGDHAACAAIYEAAARAVVAMPDDAVGPIARADLQRTLARTGRTATDRAWDLRHAFDRLLADAEFEPLMEAALPAGFPAPGPVGVVVEKTYPGYRAARSEGGNSFWTLFRHIQKNEVAMTAPVEMTMDESLRMVDMAFLYPSAQQGRAGADGGVQVMDLPPTTVLSIGMRGDSGTASVALAREALEARVASGGWKRAGEYRMMGYNSPMVPTSRKFWELQVPVTR